MEQVDLWLQECWVGLCCGLGGSRAHRAREDPGRSLQRALQLLVHPAPCNPCRKLPPARKTAQTSAGEKTLFPTCKETGGLLFLIFRKTSRWFPVAFALFLQSDAHQLPFFPSHPSPSLTLGLCFRAWVQSPAQALIQGHFYRSPHLLDRSRAVALLPVTQVKGGRKMELAQGGKILAGFNL